MRRLWLTTQLLVSLALTSATAQGVMLQGWYWDYPKQTGSAAWAAQLQNKAAGLGQAGFTHVWLPPLSRASFGFGSNGYDPKDLYDLGEFGQGPTGFGTRAQVDATITAFTNAGVSPVADVVYNHRDGGSPEVNPAVKTYVTTHYNASKQPMPSDRYYVRLPLGGASGNGAGDYYFKLSSKSGAARFEGASYKLYMATSLRSSGGAAVSEVEPNGGGDCGQTPQLYTINSDLVGNLDFASSGCQTDEFQVTLTPADFNAAGDYLNVYVTNPGGGYSDHRFYGIWNASAAQDVVGQLDYLTYTDFTALPSAQGGMNFESFRPNSANTSTTFLDGDFDFPYFFYDYDQSQPATVAALNAWTDWLFDDVGIQGLRMDAVKHFPAAYVGQLLVHLESTGRAPSMAVGEFFDGNANTLASWINAVYASAGSLATPVRAFDFSLRNALKEACDNPGSDVRQVFGAGLVDGAGMSGFNSVTFLNNHDFRGPGEPVQSDPLLGYVYLLTNNQVGLPSVFYPDYFGDAIPNAPAAALQLSIDSLIALQQSSIAGASSRTYLNKAGSGFGASYLAGGAGQALIYQLRDTPSGRDVIVAINFGGSALRVDHAIDLSGGIVQGTRFNEVMGASAFPFALVDAQNRIYIDLPARSFAVWQEAASAPLPVDLVRLSAKPDGAKNRIEWTVASERGVGTYTVERAEARDATQFSAVADVPARGTDAGGEAVYSAFDNAPARVSYYRLKATDLDGSVDYSDVVAVTRHDRVGTPGVKVYPNPSHAGASATVAVLGVDEVDGLEVTVTDAAGRQVIRMHYAGDGTHELPLVGLPAGLYLVSAVAHDAVYTERLIIK